MAAGLGRGQQDMMSLSRRGGSTGSSPLLNLRPYQQVLSDRRAVAFSLAGFVARLPMSMTGIGIVLLVSLTTGSFGQAGLLTAATTVAAAVVAPLWGRATDRWARLGSCCSRS